MHSGANLLILGALFRRSFWVELPEVAADGWNVGCVKNVDEMWKMDWLEEAFLALDLT